MPALPHSLYQAQQIRELEQIQIKQYKTPGIDLMQRAGAAVFTLIQQHYPDSPLIILTGSGHNAGDGYVVAYLAKQAGYQVNLYFVSDPKKLTGDAFQAYQDYHLADGKLQAFQINQPIPKGLIIDALLGTGLNRPVSGVYADAINLINDLPYPVIAIDIPSGVNADTGQVLGCAVKAQHTVCFIGLKQGLFTGLAADYCGQISYADLAVDPDIFKQVKPSAYLMTQPDFPPRSLSSHKGDFGHVLVIGGELGYSGAVRLAAESALRVGAGLVSVATRCEHAGLININRPELMCHGVQSAIDLEPLLERASVIVIGPGLGQSTWATDLFKRILNSQKPLIIDADGLNLLAKQRGFSNHWILTPHPGEAARLLNCSTTDIANDRYMAIDCLQQKYGGICLLKGAGTLLTDGETIQLANFANPAMASGGMGDVLAGMIGGLVAQKLALFTAAKMAVMVHAKTASQAAEEQGIRGLLASDLLPLLKDSIN